MKKQTIVIVVLATVLILLGGTIAWALPSLPSSFWGTVTVDGANVPDGTVVEACIDGVCYVQIPTSSWNGGSVYDVDVPGDDPDTPEIVGGVEGDVIVFKVDGQVADQTGTWHSGTNVELNLTVSPDRPTADFSYTVGGTRTINFTDISVPGDVPIDAWGWDFGDGGKSTAQNPTHTYSTTGTYTATFAVTDTNGLSDDVSKAVVVSSIEGPTVRVLPSSLTVGVGATTTVDIVAENVTGYDLYAFHVILGHTGQLEALGIETGPEWQNGFVAWTEVNTITHEAGIAITLVGDESTAGDMVMLATVTVRGVQSGTVPLTLTQSELWDRQSQEIPHDVQNSEIAVDAMLHVTGICQLQVRTNHTGCTVEVDSASATADSLGQYQVSALPGTYAIITASMPGYLHANTSVSGAAGETVALLEVKLRAGDVNDDCTVNIQDLVIMGGCYGEASSCSPNADFNDDGAITLPDLVAAAVNYLKECPQPWELMP